jgi:hypothetical protein
MSTGGYRYNLHHDKHPEMYRSQELEREFAATRRWDTWIVPGELYAKNPKRVFFKKWRTIPRGVRKSAHPQARVVRGFFGQYPIIERATIENKPSMLLRFRYGYDTDGNRYMFAIVDGKTKIVVEKITIREGDDSGFKLSIRPLPSGEIQISIKPQVKIPELSYYQAYFAQDGNMITLGDTPLIAVAGSAKTAIAHLLGLPLFWYKGFLYSAHDVYKSKRRRGKNKSGIHFVMPYKTKGQTRPSEFVEGFRKDHCPDGEWAWQYWNNLPTAVDPTYTSNL